MVLDVLQGLVDKKTLRWSEDKRVEARVAACGEDAALVKPETFVNETGRTAVKLGSVYGAGPERLLFVCDDANLDLGKIRFRREGGAGGHHGLESVIALLGTESFPRLRVGIRGPQMPEELPDFVLGRFSKEETARLEAVLDRAARVCQEWVHEGFEAAQTLLSRLQSVKQEEKER